MSQDSDQYSFIVQEIAAVQPRLYVFIRTLIPDAEKARDVLQEVNLILWEKRAVYDVTKEFGLWACGVARYQVMTYLKKRRRDKHVFFDEQLLSQVADETAKQSGEIDRRTQALHYCIKTLPEDQRQCIVTRYFDKQSVNSIAELFGRSPGAIAKVLFRAREALLKCINRKLMPECNSK